MATGQAMLYASGFGGSMKFTTLAHFDKKGLRKDLPDLGSTLDKLGKPGFIWIDIEDPDAEGLGVLAARLDIHPLAIEDCLDEKQIPKIDEYPTHSFILFNALGIDGDDVLLSEIDCIFSKQYLISIHGHGKPDSPTFERMLESSKRAQTTALSSPDLLLHRLMDFIVDEKYQAIEALQDRIDEAEGVILERPDEFDPRELLHLRGMLLDIGKSLSHEREAVIKACYRDSSHVSEAAVYYFRDVYDHLSKYVEFVDSCRETITNYTELYFSAVNTQMNKLSIKTNKTMRRLTMITTIFMPLTLISGIGGMSEWSMMTGPENWRIAYPAFIGGMAVIAIITGLIIRRDGNPIMKRGLKNGDGEKPLQE